jgi:hypothetical protein
MADAALLAASHREQVEHVMRAKSEARKILATHLDVRAAPILRRRKCVW